MSLHKKQLGRKGEDIAASYYQKLGYKIIIRNFYTRYGELDLVLKKNNKILVVEVKTRTSYRFGYGEESISNKKLTNIQNTYQVLSRQKHLPMFFEIEICVIEQKNLNHSIYRFLI